MPAKFLTSLCIIVLAMSACGTTDEKRTKELILQVSDNLSAHVNTEALTQSLFVQFRTRVLITDTQLSAAQIDEKVRQEIRDNYVPVLIQNYQQIYTEFKQSKSEMSECGTLTPINAKDDVLKALCYVQNAQGFTINYMTNGYSQGWTNTASYSFTLTADVATLTSIDMQMHPDATIRMNGL